MDRDEYAEAMTTPAGGLLDALAAETHESLRSPGMLSGPVAGRLLQMLVYALGARRVLEIGTYSGHATIMMAQALPEGGELHTCELDEEHAAFARRYVAEAALAERVTVHVGPALETVTSLDGPWDFVFVDADKAGYVDYYEAVLPKLAERGLIAADNTLAGDRVLSDPGDSETAKAIARFNEHVRDDPRTVQVLLTVRDGITVIRRAPTP